MVDSARFCPACGKANEPTANSGSSWPAATGAAPDMIGREIAGRYRILKKLGEGGMGAVYRGEQMSLKRSVAVKLLKPELGANAMVLQRFNAEAQAVAKLSHPNTVNIYDFGQDSDGSLFIAMEYIDGRSLRDALQKEGPFPIPRALAIARQVAASLSDAHAHSIVHRDLKPDNVMLQERGKQRDVVRVLDFGIAKLRDDSRATQAAMTQAGDMLGTPQYMAPEQIRGEAIDGRTDVYALGCMIYEMVTARLPYEGPTIMALLSKHLLEPVVPPTQRRPDLGLPPTVDQLVLSAMAKDAKDRPPTMDAFAELIDALLATYPPDSSLAVNRSGGLSMQQGAVGNLVTPPSSMFAPTPVPAGGFAPPSAPPPATPPAFAPPSAPPGFAPPAAPPPGFAPPPYAPNAAGPAPVPYSPVPSQMANAAPTEVVKSPKAGSPLYAVLGLLLVGGIGAGVYFAMRKPAPSTPSTPSTPTTPTTPSGTDPWANSGTPANGGPTKVPISPPDDPPDTPEPPDKPDPPDTDDPSPVAKNVGTARTPIPKGAYITGPAGFVKVQATPDGIAYADYSRQISVLMVPLYAGTNDPAQLAQKWINDNKNAALVSQETFDAGGVKVPVLAFTATVQGVEMVQVAALFIMPAYRLAVIYQVPKALAEQGNIQPEVEQFFGQHVHLP